MENREEKHTALFIHLALSFKTAAVQQLGKLPNPATGKIERDLPQASMTIDLLDMLAAKCKGNLAADEEQFLKHTISELKLNYIDEIGREESPDEKNEDPKTPGGPSDDPGESRGEDSAVAAPDLSGE